MEPEQEVDYLEGITSEMFGDDEEFELCASGQEAQDEDDVEALPDPHYGLLGTRGELLEPRGCMEDLPEEVLRQVLSYLPAQDLYRNAIHVCHRWSSIIQDPKVRHMSDAVPVSSKHHQFELV